MWPSPRQVACRRPQHWHCADEQQFSLNSPSWPGPEEAWQPQSMLPPDTSSAPTVPATILQSRARSGESPRTPDKTESGLLRACRTVPAVSPIHAPHTCPPPCPPPHIFHSPPPPPMVPHPCPLLTSSHPLPDPAPSPRAPPTRVPHGLRWLPPQYFPRELALDSQAAC